MSELFFPIIETERLQLRPFNLEDAPTVQTLVSEREIAKTTARIPHPYPTDGAIKWIESHSALQAQGQELVLAIVLKDSHQVVGTVGLVGVDLPHLAEIGYWVGLPYWRKGFATEAVKGLCEFGFEELGLHRIFAKAMTRNPASRKVLEKCGFRHEGLLRSSLYKWGAYEDVDVFGLLKDEYCTS